MSIFLNKEQTAALRHEEGPLLVVAGPGTGKTKTLTQRIVYLVKERRVAPENILALTFTQKAAKEMRERVKADLERGKLPFIGTFHAWCFKLLEKYYQENPRIINEMEKQKLIRFLMDQEKDSGLRFFNEVSSRDLALLISVYKNKFFDKDPGAGRDVWVGRDTEANEIFKSFAEFVQTYDEHSRQANFMDYDDLLLRTRQLLLKTPDIQKKLAQKYKHILVDEFQDTNALQYDLLKLVLTDPDNLWAIGDPNQAIYSFRGAGNQAFQKFKEDFPKTKEISLKTNYRSARAILEVSQRLWNQSGKSDKNRSGFEKLKPFKKEPGEVAYVTTLNEATEADWVIQMIGEKVGGVDFLSASEKQNLGDKQINFSDFAVIFRLHSLSNRLKRKLKDSGIPYQVAGGDSFWTSKSVKVMIEVLNALVLDDEIDETDPDVMIKLQKGGLGEIFEKERNKPGSLTDFVSKIVDMIKSRKKSVENNNLEEFLNVLGAFEEKDETLGERIKKFLAYYEKIAKNDFYDAQSDKVTLLTMHAAKGLEFKYVFVLGFCDQLVPFVKKNRKRGDRDLNAIFLDQSAVEKQEEERRLFFVAMTRAGQGLYLLYTKERFGKKDWGESQFKAEISGNNDSVDSDFEEESKAGDAAWQELEDPALVKVERRREIKRIKDSQTSLF